VENLSDLFPRKTCPENVPDLFLKTCRIYFCGGKRENVPDLFLKIDLTPFAAVAFGVAMLR
jgi:hypothetical protein